MRPTKAYDRIHGPSRFRCLPDGTTVLDIVDAARDAGLSFLSSARYGWSGTELSAWLAEAYLPSAIDAGAPSAPEDERVTHLVFDARCRLLQMLRSAHSEWRVSGFARDMVDGGLVVGVSDTDGGIGYAPVSSPRLRLVDRVASLFLADFLTRPRDYESLLVCDSCDEVSFSWDVVHEYECDARGPNSGIVVRDRKRQILTLLGMGR